MGIVRKSLDELSPSSEEVERLRSSSDKEIDYSDIPALDEEFFKNAEVRLPAGKKGIYIRLDADVLEWMKSHGKGYQSRINAILRAYYEAHR